MGSKAKQNTSEPVDFGLEVLASVVRRVLASVVGRVLESSLVLADILGRVVLPEDNFFFTTPCATQCVHMLVSAATINKVRM